MPLQIIKPVPVTDAVLTYSAVAEDSSPAWSSTTTFAANDICHDPATHRRFKSVAGGNLNHNPASTTGFWVDIGPTNRFGMFDGKMGSATAAAGSVVVRLRPGTFGGFALFGLQAAAVRYTLRSAPAGATVRYSEVSLRSGVADWWEWTFTPAEYRTSLAVTDLPALADPELEIEIVGIAGASASCAEAVLGSVYDIGGVQYDVSLELVDYSRKDIDAYGTVTLIKRDNVKRINAVVQYDNARFSAVTDLMASVLGTSIAAIVDQSEDLDALNSYCWLSSFKEAVKTARLTYANIEFMGLN